MTPGAAAGGVHDDAGGTASSESVFHISSTTQPMTAAMIMKQQEQGQLALANLVQRPKGGVAATPSADQCVPPSEQGRPPRSDATKHQTLNFSYSSQANCGAEPAANAVAF